MQVKRIRCPSKISGDCLLRRVKRTSTPDRLEVSLLYHRSHKTRGATSQVPAAGLAYLVADTNQEPHCLVTLDLKISASQPISRVLSWTVIRLALQSPAGSSSLPGPDAGRALVGPYLALLQVGFTIASSVTRPAVRSYRTFSPLPLANERRFPFCCTFRRLSPPRRYLAPCPVEPGLSSPSFEAATAWPTRGAHNTGNPTNRKCFSVAETLNVSPPYSNR